MKKLFLLICILPLISGWATAQDQPAAWDSTYRPATYPLLSEQFKSFKHSTSDIVFLGNSITFGVDWYELLQMPQARNRGISGDMTFGVLERLQEIIDGKPAKLFILIGVNDVLRNVPDNYIINNYNKIISRVTKGSPNTRIYIQSILPINETFAQRKNNIGKSERILAVNQALKQIAENYHVTYIDLHTAFKTPEGMLDASLTYDGLHLNLNGYQRWKETLQKGGYLKKNKKK
jgi:lysophospholipase L1-like esterase